MGKLEQVQALENGKGIQYLLNAACKIFYNPMYTIDIDYNVIAFTDVPVDDPVWNEIVTQGTYSMESQELLAKERFIENVSNANKSIILKSDAFQYARLVNLFSNRDNIAAGIVVMYDCNAPFDDECVAAFEIFTDKITNEIKNYDYFTMLAMTFYEDKINLLLDKSVKNPFLFNPQAQVLYNNFDDYLYVAVVSVERNNILEHVHRSRLAYFKSLLKTKYPSFKYSVYSDYIVMLMSSKHRSFYSASFFSAYAGLFEQNGLFMGISGSFENMYEMRVYYDQAVAALTNGLASTKDMRVFLYTGAE